MVRWVEKTPECVRDRYDRLAPICGLFAWTGGVRFPGVREKSVEALRLHAGDTVLEIGRGDGRNFARIEQQIGPTGTILGVDVSAGMLARAEARCQRRGWSNVHLTQGDAGSFVPPSPVRAALFCFSYSTMRDRLAILGAVWDHLAPGGRLVITDAGFTTQGRYRRSMGLWVSDRTLLGNPGTEPWADLASMAGSVEQQRVSTLGRQDVICAATKPAKA